MFFDLEKVCIAFLLKVFSQRLHSVLQLAAPLPINMCNKQHGNNNVRIYTNCTRTMMSMNDSTEEREREFTGVMHNYCISSIRHRDCYFITAHFLCSYNSRATTMAFISNDAWIKYDCMSNAVMTVGCFQ